MPDDVKSDAGVVQSIADNLGAFFRHLFPGVLIVGAAYVAYPSWFTLVKTDSWQHIVIVAVIALTVGNIWFALNRYGVHQAIDYAMYFVRIPGPARGSGRPRYRHDLGQYVARSVSTPGISKAAQQHVKFRASSVLLLYIVGETGFVFWRWHEQNTIFARHSGPIFWASVAIFCAGIWQDAITRNIDYCVLEFGDNTKSGQAQPDRAKAAWVIFFPN
jgi:hypothetical protein